MFGNKTVILTKHLISIQQDILSLEREGQGTSTESTKNDFKTNNIVFSHKDKYFPSTGELAR